MILGAVYGVGAPRAPDRRGVADPDARTLGAGVVFSSPTFLFVFLPVCLLGYLLVPVRWRNGWLLGASIVFYVWGAGGQVGIILFVSLVAFAGALIAYRAGRGGALGSSPRWLMISLIGLLLVPIFVFKYFSPIWSVVRGWGLPVVSELGPVTWALPLGISFFTFHAISYAVDVSRGKIPPERSLRDFLLYLFLFPHQIAGPIVRYSEIRDEMKSSRFINSHQAVYGVTRFSWGLMKKACIADPVGVVANAAFASSGSSMGTTTAWLGAIAYTLQIYFDFSGYSDMAIGLAMMFGFHFPENFSAPYRSVSVTDFWRRWHMTLSRWFRDYVYIPLGGSRQGIRREYAALLSTFALTSLWHGATAPFLVWGALHSGALVVERLTGYRHIQGWVWLRRGILALFVVLSWVPFRSRDMGQALDVWRAMISWHPAPMPPAVLVAITPITVAAILVGLLEFLGPGTTTGFRTLFGATGGAAAGRFHARRGALLAPVLMIVSITLVLWLDFSPFLYFQF